MVAHRHQGCPGDNPRKEEGSLSMMAVFVPRPPSTFTSSLRCLFALRLEPHRPVAPPKQFLILTVL